MQMMKQLLLLFIASGSLSCSGKSTEQQPQVQVQAQQSTLAHLPGQYNKKEDTWENSDPAYDQYIGFDGHPYAAFSRLDKDGNSLGMGLIDKTGKVRVQPVYTGGISVGFTSGFCEVQDSSGKYGLVNEAGVEVIKPQYESTILIGDYLKIDSSIFKVVKNGKSGIIDRTGKILIPIQYEALDLAGEGLLMYMAAPQQWGVMDIHGKVITEPVFTHTNIFVKGKTSLQQADGE